jgi:ELWxxDGT repeat protein
MRRSILGVIAATVALVSAGGAVEAAAADAPSSNPAGLVRVGDVVFFQAHDGSHGKELWKSNGTPGGTVLVKDINPGTSDGWPAGLIPVESQVFFAASDGVHGSELWKSDGTEGGTAMVEDITPGPGTTGIHILTAVGSEIFFAVENPGSDQTLWKSDGTADGTTEVRPLGGSVLDSGSGPSALAVGSTLYFIVLDDAHGLELWKSDGTPEGTSIVTDLNPGPNDGVHGELHAWGSHLYFSGDDGIHGTELWSTNGTAEGTHLVKDINRGSESSWPAGLTSFGNLLLFAADNGATNGQELWRTDGTRAGTVLVKDITPLGHRKSRPGSITPIGKRALLTAFRDRVLYRTDGTAEGTHIVRRPRNGGPTAIGDNAPGGERLVRVTGIGVLFDAAVASLWKSNGWRGGTAKIMAIDPFYITALGPSLALFSADDGIHGQELWATEGTTSGTHLVADINP